MEPIFRLSEAPIQSATQSAGIDFSWGIKIPMRDNVLLNATLYLPHTANPTPVIFTLTPYMADSYHPRAMYFAETAGYAFALVDCRGRGNSEGSFDPFFQEVNDSYDIVEWLAAQPWCDGQVTMWGGSYGGFDQWMALKSLPPHLKTVVPVASACVGVDFPAFRFIFACYAMRWLTLTSGNLANNNLFGEEKFWIGKFREWAEQNLPFNQLDRVVGNPSPIFQEWLRHPHMDDYWERARLTPEELARIHQPILSITGHYDGDQPGALAFYRDHMRWGSPEAKEKHFLVIGPWDHAGTRTPKKEFDGLKLGDASLIDMNKLHKEWYDWTMKDGARPEFLKQHVAYYLMGADEWKYADSLESISNETLALYLSAPNGVENDVFHSGLLADAPPAESEPGCFTYDPMDHRFYELEKDAITDYLTQQRYALNLFGNGLVYHSLPFTEDTEITGTPRFTATIAMDVPDTDFSVTLSEVLPDGSHILLSSDVIRARFRESVREEQLVRPGIPERYLFDQFTFFSRRIVKGSRLRLVFQCQNSIYLMRNYNSGGVVAEESGADARVAHVKLYHDAKYPACLELPVVRGEKKEEEKKRGE